MMMNPTGSLGFPRMNPSPPIMAPGAAPAAATAAPAPAPTGVMAMNPGAMPAGFVPPAGNGGAPKQPHPGHEHQMHGQGMQPGFMDRLQARFGGADLSGMLQGFQSRHPGVDLGALMARFGGGAPAAPAAVAAPAAPAAVAPTGVVQNRPAQII